jgi:hypothetical protein
LSASSPLGGVECGMVCLLKGVHWAVWESCGGAEAGQWGGMVGLVSTSAVLGGMECAAVRLVRGVHWACGKWQLQGCRWMALGGVGWGEMHALCWLVWTAQRV